VDTLKIDKAIIVKLGKSYEDTALVSTAIELSHAFGLKAVAEGVEIAGQLRQLRRLGCDQAQGYYFSIPLPGRAMSELLAGNFENDPSGLPR
jgi:EAL domain-containing protein (putative c-di-GMP-specific phosphodiesterase class I)